MRKPSFELFFAVQMILVIISAASLHAQDSRTVTEPSFPPACAVLRAHQVAGSLDETEFDTSRIQAKT